MENNNFNEKWIEKYSDSLFNYANYRLNNRELSLDLVQDTYLSAFKSYTSFEEKSSVKTWLISILKRKIIDYWRKNSRYQVYNFSAFDNNENNENYLTNNFEADNGKNIEDKINNIEMGKILSECIDNLNEPTKSIFIDKYIKRKDTESICNDYNITATNLWVIIHRAKTKLREELNLRWIK